MTGPVSNYPASGTVEGLLTDAYTYGVGAHGIDYKNIFFPDYSIAVTSQGEAERAEGSVSSIKDDIPFNYFKECQENQNEFNQDELKARLNKVDEKAERVSTPLNVVLKIVDLVKEKELLYSRLENINKCIEGVNEALKALVGPLFAPCAVDGTATTCPSAIDTACTAVAAE
ncbi:MAG: hypothetical protein WCF65_02090 [Parachlamydiaceae bacterium]